MSIHKSNIIVFILLFLAWVLLIISYSDYWYLQNTKFNSGEYMKISTKYDLIKRQYKYPDGTKTTDFQAVNESKANTYQLKIYKASLAFAAIAWIVLTINLFLMLLGTFSEAFQKLSILPTIVKFLPGVSLILAFISLFIFVGIPKAMLKDCQKVSNLGVCESEQYHNFYGSTETSSYTYTYGPNLAWASVVVADGLLLVSLIVSIVCCKYTK